MLERVLQAIAAGGALSLAELARQLDVAPALLEAMMENLEKMGYLQALEGGCQKACGSCASKGICAMIGGGKVWSLSEKGARAAAGMAPA